MSVKNLPHGTISGEEVSYTGEICCDECEEVLAEISSDTPIDSVFPCVCNTCREIGEIPEVLHKFTLNVTKPSFLDMYFPTEKTVCVCEKNKLHPIFSQDDWPENLRYFVFSEALIFFIYILIALVIGLEEGKCYIVLLLAICVSHLSFSQGKRIKTKEEEPKK